MRITRRQFLWSTATAAAGLAVGYGAWRVNRYFQVRRRAPPLGVGAWIEIGADGKIRIFCNATEMGQGAWSALAQLVSEELEADWSMITVSMAPVQTDYHAPWGYGTGGSRSVRGMFDMMRRIGAAARIMLLEAASRRWNVPQAECVARLGTITHAPSGRSIGFGAVASDAAALPVPRNPPLKTRAQWRLIGKSMPRVDVPAKVDGKALYGCDIRLPGLRYAAIRHCPVVGGRLKSVATAPALAVAGVEQVVQLDDAVVVLATSTWQAMQGLRKLEPEWNLGEHATTASDEMLLALHNAIEGGEARLLAKDADARKSAERVATALREAVSKVTATYQAPLLSHAQLEPMNATAWYRDGGIEIWAPTQEQSDLRQEVADALGIAQDRVTVHTPLVGGGFGRRLINDVGVEAALIARQSGHPVQVLWDREEDFHRGIFRPAAVARLQAALGTNGLVRALDIRVASLDRNPRAGGMMGQPYEIAAKALHYAAVPRGIRIGAWRSVDMSQNTFFLESFLDECATHAKSDPLDLRLALLKNSPRECRVLEAVAELAGWHRRQADGRHLGLAFASAFYSLAALVAEAVVVEGRLRISRIFAVVDCGTAVNPGNIVAQMQGGILMALSATLAEEITVRDGRVQQSGYGMYPILTISQAPPIEIRILESPDAPVGGIGEVGVPITAPAVTNAVFAATGVRVRSLPLRKDARVQWQA